MRLRRRIFIAALALLPAAAAFAENEYKYVDAPVLNALTYFFGTLGYFKEYARKIGIVIASVSLGWDGIQLVFGTKELKKVVVGQITRFLAFTAILWAYFPVTRTISRVATGMGMSVGYSKEKIASNLTLYMNKFQSQIDREESADAAQLEALSIKIDDMKALGADDVASKGYAYAGYGTSYRQSLEAEKSMIEARKKMREKHPDKKRQRLASIRAVLAQTGGGAGSYLSDMSLKYGGADTGFLSPDSVMRLAVLMGDIIRLSPDFRADPETGELVEVEKTKGFLDKINPAMNLAYIGEKILAWLLSIFLLVCTIFALVQYVMTALEWSIVTGIGAAIIPFILFEGTKSFADGLLKAFFAMAVKMVVITECMMFMMLSYTVLMDNVIGTTNFGLSTVGYIVFTVILCFMLTQYAPQVAQTIISGNPQLSMGEFVKAAGTAALTGSMAGRVGLAKAKLGAAAAGGGIEVGNALSTAAREGGRDALFEQGKKIVSGGAGRAAKGAMTLMNAAVTPGALKEGLMKGDWSAAKGGENSFTNFAKTMGGSRNIASMAKNALTLNKGGLKANLAEVGKEGKAAGRSTVEQMAASPLPPDANVPDAKKGAADAEKSDVGGNGG